MRIRIETDCRRGLRIIDEIPNIPLGRLQGYNGIGKSNAIKLLRLCTGEQPFAADPASWRTFRQQLLAGRVEVTNLTGARSIEWTLDPSAWPDAPQPLGSRIGSIQIDNTPANITDVAALLRVHHINAAETPLSVLSTQVSSARDHLDRWLTSVGAQRQGAADEALSRLQESIIAVFPSQLEASLTEAEEAKRLLGEHRAKLDEEEDRARKLSRAISVLDDLTQVRDRGPELADMIAELDQSLKDLDVKKRALDGKIASASQQETAHRAAEREFANAEKFLNRNVAAFNQAESMLARKAAQAGVEPSTEAVASEQAQITRRLAELNRLLPQVNATPVLSTLLAGIIQSLTAAEDRGLGDSVLIEATSADFECTVSQLRTACQRQETLLASKTPTADAEALQEEIVLARRRLDLLAQVGRSITEVATARSNVRRAQKRIKQATAALPSGAAATLDQLIGQRNEIDTVVGTTQARRAKLAQTLELLGGGETEESLAADLAQLCRETGVDAARVRKHHEEAVARVRAAQLAHAHAVQRSDRLADAVRQQTEQIRRLVTDITGEGEFDWLRGSIPESAHLETKPLLEQARILSDMVVALEGARNRLGVNWGAVQSISAAFRQLSGAVANPDAPQTRQTPWYAVARRWLAEQVRQWFADDAIRHSLFDDGTDVKLNAEDLSVSWLKNGEPQERPLSAFSSGQQAFAYTKARLIQLEQSSLEARNRLIALDEFGAFLDAERMANLQAFLASRQERFPTDQILMILPLERRPTADGGMAALQIKDLETRGFITERIVA